MRANAVVMVGLLLGCDGRILGPGPLVPPSDPMLPTTPAAWVRPGLADRAGAEPLGVRRLTASEYAATLEDLLGVAGADAYLVNESGSGFSNRAAALTVTLSGAQAYALAAEKIATEVVARERSAAFRARVEAETSSAGVPIAGGRDLLSNEALDVQVTVPAGAGLTFTLSARVWEEHGGPDYAHAQLRVDGLSQGEYEIRATAAAPEVIAKSVTLMPGTHSVGVAFVNDYYVQGPNGLENRNLVVDWIEVSGAGSAAAPRVVVCDPAQPSCVEPLVTGFLTRAFRRPPSADERTRYLAMFAAANTSLGTDDALTAVVEAALQSPAFLYRTESEALDSWELASRLSYLAWGSMPDAELFRAAGAQELATADQRSAQLERLMADPRAARMLRRFVTEWLGISRADVQRKASEVLAGTAPTLQADLEEEVKLLVEATLLPKDGRLDQLLAARFGFINAPLAALYGLPAPTGAGFERVSFENTPRRGVLTAGLLFTGQAKESGDASIVQLGRFVREHLLCQEIPPPPPGIDTKLPESFPADWTFRQKFESYTQTSQPCVGCHINLNGPGFAYLRFDPIGRYRTQDAKGRPIDSTGKLTALDGETVTFEEAHPMIDAIAQSKTAASCFTRMFLESALGRKLAQADAPLDDALYARFSESHGSARVLLDAFVRSDSFTRRTAR